MACFPSHLVFYELDIYALKWFEKVQMYAGKVAARYEHPPPPTALSKVGKYALGNEETRVACKFLRSASSFTRFTRDPCPLIS